MIDVVFVDAGGVLFNNVTEETTFIARVAREYGAEPALLRAAVDDRDLEYEVDDRHVHAVLVDCLIAAGAPHARLDPDWIDAQYLASVRANDVVFAFLRALREVSSRPRLALANNEAAHFDEIKDRRFGHFGLFDEICSSWRLRAVKPSEVFFARMLEVCHCTGQHAVLVDDNPHVVQAAAALGVVTVLVEDPDDLPARLGDVLSS